MRSGLTPRKACGLLWTSTIRSISGFIGSAPFHNKHHVCSTDVVADRWLCFRHHRPPNLHVFSHSGLQSTSLEEASSRTGETPGEVAELQRWFDFLDDEEDPYDACWSADSLSVNPGQDERLNAILQGLKSPAPQSFYIIQRGLVRSQQKPCAVGERRTSVLEQCSYLLKDGCQFVLRPNSREGDIEPGLDWSVLALEVRDNNNGYDNWEIQSFQAPSSSLQIAHEILELASKASAQHAAKPNSTIDDLLTKLHNQLDLTLGTNIRGRSSADTAFNLAMAGVSDDSLFQKLLQTSYQEMKRTARRKSRKARDVAGILEKLAASGLREKDFGQIYDILPEVECTKGSDYDIFQHFRESRPRSEFNLLSPRPLKCLWRFSARQAKIREQALSSTCKRSPIKQAREAMYDRDWIHRLEDTSRPLVIDIGCGFGTSLLGMASQTKEDTTNNNLPMDFQKCNFVGGDLSQLLIGFGQGISKRWDLHQKIQFCYMPAYDLLEQVLREYPGPIAMILIQFPSPYRLLDEGNSQLPSGADDPSFMVTKELMSRVQCLLSKSESATLLLQSNCEDVAVTLRNLGREHGLAPIESVHPIISESDQAPPSKRTIRWMELGGGPRAIGSEWSSEPLLPLGCRTETEMAYILDNKPVHRCWMRADKWCC